jgi:hypothetical protein
MQPHFDGATYSPARDHVRLTRQLDVVKEYMKDGEWRTLNQIAQKTEKPVTSISARLRDLRKTKFGSHTVERRLAGPGLYEYRLTVA